MNQENERNHNLLQFFERISVPSFLNQEVSIIPVEEKHIEPSFDAFLESKIELCEWMNWAHTQTKESISFLYSFFSCNCWIRYL